MDKRKLIANARAWLRDFEKRKSYGDGYTTEDERQAYLIILALLDKVKK